MAEKHVSSGVAAGEGCRMRGVEVAEAPLRVMIAFQSFGEKYHFFFCLQSFSWKRIWRMSRKKKKKIAQSEQNDVTEHSGWCYCWTSSFRKP